MGARRVEFMAASESIASGSSTGSTAVEASAEIGSGR